MDRVQRDGKNPQGGDDQFRVQTINRIRLHGSKNGSKVKFNCEDNVGYWHYVWVDDGPSPRGYMMIEFKASHKQKKHETTLSCPNDGEHFRTPPVG